MSKTQLILAVVIVLILVVVVIVLVFLRKRKNALDSITNKPIAISFLTKSGEVFLSNAYVDTATKITYDTMGTVKGNDKRPISKYFVKSVGGGKYTILTNGIGTDLSTAEPLMFDSNRSYVGMGQNQSVYSTPIQWGFKDVRTQDNVVHAKLVAYPQNQTAKSFICESTDCVPDKYGNLFLKLVDYSKDLEYDVILSVA